MSTPNSNSVGAFLIELTGDEVIDSLLSGIRWGSTNSTSLTYSFATSSSQWSSPTYSIRNEPHSGVVQSLTAQERGNAAIALNAWAHYTNISLSEVGDNSLVVGDIRFAATFSTDPEEQAYAYFPDITPSGGDIWLNARQPQEGLQPGSYGFFAALHEIGHALGLKHPFEAVGDNSTLMPADLDSLNYTVMSYQLYPGVSGSGHALSYYPTTPMALDIAVIRALYSKASVNPTDTIYSFNQGADYFQTIVDTGGNDTIVWNGTTEGGQIDLEAGTWSDLGNSIKLIDSTGAVESEDELNVFLYFDSVIENATGGGGDDLLSGNDMANLLNGMAGHDYLYGYDGADTLVGGDGNDHLYGRYHTAGADGADSLSGGAGIDFLQGNAGNDTLDGGEGGDRILGGANDDVITGGSGNDTVNGNLGDDLVNGQDGNDSLRGGQGNDSLLGGAGDDLLSGDVGADMLTGGSGADLFIVSSGTSLSASPDRITDYADGVDHIAIGFAPVLLTGSSSLVSDAAVVAQQLMDANSGDGELVAMKVGSSSYLFYSGTGGATIDSTLILTGVGASLIDTGDFI